MRNTTLTHITKNKRAVSPAGKVLLLGLEIPPAAYVVLTGEAPLWIRIWMGAWLSLWLLGTVILANRGGS